MEIEVKFPLKDHVEEKIKNFAEFVKEKFEEDLYFSHPSRDFAITDEALRIRRDAEGVTVTYKGPKIDKETKSREEIKLKVSDFDSAVLLFEKLGFRKFWIVKKKRKIYKFRDVIFCIDDVEPLGRFIEIELEGGIERKEELFNFASMLGYRKEESITKSYLEMLIELKNP